MDSISYNEYIDCSNDDKVWKPINKDEQPYFLQLIEQAESSLINGTKKEKGDAMEHLMTFIYKRFKAIRVYDNVFKGDNQIDHIIEFIDGAAPTFIHTCVGLRLIGESKNHKKSIGPREVNNLDELLRSKSSKLGIFSSSKSFSKGKTMWNLSEGKRRKLAIASNRKIIGFTIKELKTLTTNNFYTMMQQKYYNLVDEIEDDYSDSDNKLPYHESLFNSIKQLNKLGLLDDEATNDSIKKLKIKYGAITKDKD